MPNSLFQSIVVACVACVVPFQSQTFGAQLRSSNNLNGAREYSARTGHPLLVIATQESCVPCRKLKHELQTNPEIQTLVKQCVKVILDCDSVEYADWIREHRPVSNTLPQLFFVRADGRALINQTGKPERIELKRMLSRAVEQSGTILSEDHRQQIETLIDEIRQQLEADDLLGAAELVNSSTTLLRIVANCHASAANRLRQLLLTLNQQLRDRIDNNRQRIENLDQVAAEDRASAVAELRTDLERLQLLRPVVVEAKSLVELAELNPIYRRENARLPK